MSALILNLIIVLPVIILSVVVHENAHGYVAYLLGDKTAKNAGRLSLNPLKHIDPFGSVLLPLILAATGAPILGYAKPVPINPAYFKDQRRGMMFTGMAGPISNFLVAVLGALIFRLLVGSSQSLIAQIIYLVIFINVLLGIFNLLPIPPLDGSKVVAGLMPKSMLKSYYRFEYYAQRYFIIVFIIIIIFGQRILFNVLSSIINPIMRFLLGVG